jgi:hypothetical protein
MRLSVRGTILLGLCAWYSTGAWGVGELDVTIRVIERHERLDDISLHRIELPRESSAAARERIPARWQEENGPRFREAADRADQESLDRPRGEFEWQGPRERAREWSNERNQGREERRRDERRPAVAGERPRH